MDRRLRPDDHRAPVPAPGAKAGEVGICISLAETEQELREGARSHGWALDHHIEVFELVPPDSALDPERHQSLLYSCDLELGETVTRIFDAIGRLKPNRVVIDSLSEIRLLAKARCATGARSSP